MHDASQLPTSIFGYVRRISGRHQIALLLLSVVVFLLSAARVVQGRIEIGTVVAFISRLGKVIDPWGDAVNWFREVTAARMRYGLLSDALN